MVQDALFGWIFLIAVIAGIYFFISSMNKPETTQETPEEILKKEYTSDELTTEEYEERKKILDRDKT